MSIKSILVHITADEGGAERSSFALKLAKKFNAKVFGVYVEKPVPPLISSANVSLAASEAHSTFAAISYENQLKIVEQQKEKVREMLAEALPVGERLPWSVIRNQERETLFELARYHDLILVGEDFSIDDPLEIISNPTAKLAVESSCPVLVVPNDFDKKVALENPLVAWNGSRESSRAVRDAVPFLRRADSVTIMKGKGRKDFQVKMDDNEASLLRYLRLQDVDAHYVATDMEGDSFGELLSDRVEKNDHDFLVLGAYDHSRVKELIVGSTARSLIGNVSIPILLSH